VPHPPAVPLRLPQRSASAGSRACQPITRIEGEAAAKLGLDRSLAEAGHAAERAERALDLVEWGRRVRAADLHLDRGEVRPRLRRRRVARWEQEHEAAVQALLREAEHARRVGANPALVAEVGHDLSNSTPSGSCLSCPVAS
jgi:hypothetical protein